MARGELRREGSLDAPARHPLDWRSDDFHNQESLFTELARVFDICHGCRRCISLCQAFPTLFDLVDGSETLEVDGVAKDDYWRVVDHCYLCDLCFMTKCPYVPPHEWNVDFPHLMLRAKAVKFEQGNTRARDRLLSSTDSVGRLASLPLVASAVNAVNKSKPLRKALQAVLDVHADAVVPEYHSRTLRKRLAPAPNIEPEATETTRGKVALFATCYCNYNAPHLGEDLAAVFAHNGIAVTLVGEECCCGMPKLEVGDLGAVAAYKGVNIPALAQMVDEGWDLVAAVPSCVLMFKQELPLMYPDDPGVAKVRDAFYDPFEYLWLRHKAGKLKTDFKNNLGKVAYHVACHLRVQNMGLKTRDVLQLVPGTEIEAIERCSGHDGTYAVKTEFHASAVKIGKPVMSRVDKAAADHFASDCPMAAAHIAHGLASGQRAEHPLSLLRSAYGI
jgi:Fe-S oxidoreductase